MAGFHSVWVAYSDDGGATWTDQLVYDAGPGHDGSEIFADLTLDDVGNPYVAFTMNILPEVIIPLLPELRPHVGGALIVSGILTSLRHDVISAANRCGFRLEREREKGEWWAAGLV